MAESDRLEGSGVDEQELQARIGEVAEKRYRIVRLLGVGGMGAVYEAEHLELGRRVAIKSLHTHLESRADIVSRFRREAMATSAIGHPNIIEVTDTGRFDDGAVFMALEYLEGRDLATVLRQDGPLPIARAVHVATQICDALAVAHDKGIVHRDLKPENVFLISRDGDPDFVKVLDFGISKVQDALEGGVTTLTKTGTTVGTPFYMAPEQAEGHKDVDRRVDVYALGVILFRILTGQHPFEDESYPMLVLKICTEPPPPLRRYRADVPPELEALVHRMLRKERDDRPAGCREVKQQLAAFATLDAEPIVLDAPRTSDVRAAALARRGRDDSPLAHAPTTPVAQTPTTAPERGEAEARSDALGEDGEVEAPDGLAAAGLGDARRRRRGPLLWAGLALGAAGLLAGALAWRGGGDPRPPEDQGPTLPEPAPPVTRPLTTPREDGWQWVNPLPRAMPTWRGVAVAGPDRVAMVGAGGEMAVYHEDKLVRWRTGLERDLRAVDWIGPATAIVAGAGGTLQLVSAGGTQPIRTPTDTDLWDVVALSATEAIAVGDDGTILHVSGASATAEEAPTDAALLGVYARGERVLVVGDGGTILRRGRKGFTEERSGTSSRLRAVGGCPSGPPYAAGDNGEVIRRGERRWHPLDGTGREPWSAIACDGDRVVIVGRRGGVLLVAGDEVVRLDGGSDRALHAASGLRGARTWIAGDLGRMALVDGDHVVNLDVGPRASLHDAVETEDGGLVAVGEWGAILRTTDDGLQEQQSPTEAALAGVAHLEPGRLIAVGDYGAVVLVDDEGAREVETPSEGSWRDVVADDGWIVAVGAGGALLRGTPGALHVGHVQDAPALWGVAGTPEDAIAVGETGTVLRLRDGATRPVRCEIEATLRAVMRGEAHDWAVGDDGIIVRIDGDGCTVEHDDGDDLYGVGRGPSGRPLAVGRRGTALARTSDGTWRPLELGVGSARLRAVVSGSSGTWIVGTRGVVLHHAAP